MTVNKTVELDLVGIDSNAYSILAAFENQARKEKWTKDEIEAVRTEAMNSDYDHLLATILNHCEINDEAACYEGGEYEDWMEED